MIYTTRDVFLKRKHPRVFVFPPTSLRINSLVVNNVLLESGTICLYNGFRVSKFDNCVFAAFDKLHQNQVSAKAYPEYILHPLSKNKVMVVMKRAFSDSTFIGNVHNHITCN